MRLTFLAVVLLLASGYVSQSTRAEEIPTREPLGRIPYQIAGWKGQEAPRFSAAIEGVLGVDEYVNRVYSQAGDPYVSLYIGYYKSQRQGDSIHSPMNCLPGAGWLPVDVNRADVPVSSPDGRIHVNRYVIQKGIDRQVVLYWYQSHGRVIASEYWSKAYMVYDAMRLNRTDAALVRVISPVMPNENDERAAAARATRFVQAMFPLLGTYLPS